jgi:hypothetical protein
MKCPLVEARKRKEVVLEVRLYRFLCFFVITKRLTSTSKGTHHYFDYLHEEMYHYLHNSRMSQKVCAGNCQMNQEITTRVEMRGGNI